MKLSMFLFLTFITFSIKAEIFQIECVSKDIEGVHRFDLKGILVTDDFNSVEGIINVKTVKSNEPSSVQIFEQIRVAGFLRIFKQGDISKTEFQQFFLKTDGGYLKNMNLLIGLDAPHASRIVAVDNFLYRSECNYVAE